MGGNTDDCAEAGGDTSLLDAGLVPELGNTLELDFTLAATELDLTLSAIGTVGAPASLPVGLGEGVPTGPPSGVGPGVGPLFTPPVSRGYGVPLIVVTPWVDSQMGGPCSAASEGLEAMLGSPGREAKSLAETSARARCQCLYSSMLVDSLARRMVASRIVVDKVRCGQSEVWRVVSRRVPSLPPDAVAVPGNQGTHGAKQAGLHLSFVHHPSLHHILHPSNQHSVGHLSCASADFRTWHEVSIPKKKGSERRSGSRTRRSRTRVWPSPKHLGCASTSRTTQTGASSFHGRTCPCSSSLRSTRPSRAC